MSFLGPNFKKMRAARDIDSLIRIYATDKPKNKIKAGEVLVQLMDPALAKQIVTSDKLDLLVRAYKNRSYKDESDPIYAIIENDQAQAVAVYLNDLLKDALDSNFPFAEELSVDLEEIGDRNWNAMVDLDYIPLMIKEFRKDDFKHMEMAYRSLSILEEKIIPQFITLQELITNYLRLMKHPECDPPQAGRIAINIGELIEQMDCGSVNIPELLAEYLEFIQASEPLVQQSALIGLGGFAKGGFLQEIMDADGMKFIIRKVRKLDPFISYGAVCALEEIAESGGAKAILDVDGDYAILEALKRTIESEEFDEYDEYRNTLVLMGSEVVPSLLKWLDEEDPIFIENIVLVLREIGDARAIEPLKQLLVDVRSRELERTIRTALQELGTAKTD